MLGMETVAERMADYFVRDNPTMPGSSKTAQEVDATRCLEDSEHASMMTSARAQARRRPRREFERVPAVLARLRDLRRHQPPYELGTIRPKLAGKRYALTRELVTRSIYRLTAPCV
jgi:hypothetical protein